MRQASQEWPGHEVRAEELRHHFGIAQKVLTPLVLIQVHYGNDQQCVRHQLVADDHRVPQLGLTWHFQKQRLNQVRPNQRWQFLIHVLRIHVALNRDDWQLHRVLWLSERFLLTWHQDVLLMT